MSDSIEKSIGVNNNFFTTLVVDNLEVTPFFICKRQLIVAGVSPCQSSQDMVFEIDYKVL